MPLERSGVVRLRIVDLAIKEKLTYRTAYDMALAGKFGPVERDGGKLVVVVPEPAPEPGSPA